MKKTAARLRNIFVKPEFIKFLFVGLANTAFSSVVYLVLDLVLPYKIAYSMAYVSGLVLSYLLNAKWVFQASVSKKSFFTFPLVYVPQYLISVLCLHVLVERYGISERVAFFLVIILSIPVTFLLSRIILKPKQNHHSPGAGA